MRKLLIILLLISGIDSYSQEIFSKADSSEVLLYKRTKGYSTALNKEDSFYIRRDFYYGLFIIDNYYYFKNANPYKIDTLLKLNDRWLVKKNNWWQTYFYLNDFEKKRKWKIFDGDYCYLNTPLRLTGAKKKYYIYNLSYCDDLGNNLNTEIYFDINKGIVKMILKNGVVFELIP